jgi:hypothetical protein
MIFKDFDLIMPEFYGKIQQKNNLTFINITFNDYSKSHTL